MLALMANCGLREIEVCRATVGDLRTVAGAKVLYVTGKGHDTADEFVRLPGPVFNVVADWLAVRGPAKVEDPLFCSLANRNRGQALTTRSVRRVVDGYLAAAGLKRETVSGHSLRHSAATLGYLAGMDVAQLQQAMRHRNIETTMVYVHRLSAAQNPTFDAVAEMIWGSPSGS